MKFYKKTRIPLKNQFGKEPEFSKWLASDEGIEYIKQALGIELITEGTEVRPNNQFSVDILMKVDPQYSNGEPAKVVIENQYDRTDHEHFSKLITYAITNEAKYAVWIAEEIHPEHKAAIDWLNANTNDNINFYVFQAVIEQIDDSQPSFSLISICEPKEELKINMSERKDLNDLDIAQLHFWMNFKSGIDSGKYPFKSRKASAKHWYNISTGSSTCRISICMLSLEKQCRIDLWIPDNKELYDALYAKKEEIEETVGRSLIWDRKEDSKASSISYLFEEQFDIYNSDEYDNYTKIILTEIKEHFYKITHFIK